MIRLVRFSILAAALIVITSCSSDDKPTSSDGDAVPADTAFFATDIQPVLATRCATSVCHGNQANPTGGLFLGNPPDYTTVRNASGSNGAAVLPGNGPGSYLYLKTTSVPTIGVRMPKTGDTLTIAQQEDIRVWINAGALDN